MRRLLIAGDVHGNIDHCEYLTDIAAEHHADAVVQLGDFGFWEHIRDGVDFLDQVNEFADDRVVPWYVIDGNHDKTSLVLDKYSHMRDVEGFLTVRPHVRYAPRGHRWTWNGMRFIALGGAYSVDKQRRLREEKAAAQRPVTLAAALWDVPEGVARYLVADVDVGGPGTQWFPEEQMTDQEMDAILAADSSPVDVMLTHDKPRASSLGIPLSDISECMPNQFRLQRAVRALQPKLLLHGHLHHRYTDYIRAGDDEAGTRVEGLGADPRAWRDKTVPYRVEDSWMVLDLPLDEIASTLMWRADDV